MDEKTLKKMIKWAQKQGFHSFEAEGIKVIFGEPPIPKKASSPITEPTDPIPVTDDPNVVMPSDSDLLFWSTDAVDLIESRKDDTPRN
jgi:hypothetical protein